MYSLFIGQSASFWRCGIFIWTTSAAHGRCYWGAGKWRLAEFDQPIEGALLAATGVGQTDASAGTTGSEAGQLQPGVWLVFGHTTFQPARIWTTPHHWAIGREKIHKLVAAQPDPRAALYSLKVLLVMQWLMLMLEGWPLDLSTLGEVRKDCHC